MEVKIFNYLPDDAQMIRQKVFVDEQGFKEEFDKIAEGEEKWKDTINRR